MALGLQDIPGSILQSYALEGKAVPVEWVRELQDHASTGVAIE